MTQPSTTETTDHPTAAAAGAAMRAVTHTASGQRDPRWWLGALALTSLVPPLVYHLQVLRQGRSGPLPSRAFALSALGALGAYGTVVGAQLIYRLDMVLVATFRPARQVAFYGVAVCSPERPARTGPAAARRAPARRRPAERTPRRRARGRRCPTPCAFPLPGPPRAARRP
ncbi:hypothetical protein [Frankia sp. AiPa1]|uniref:hypothetical protein n=1 Tax=Frankia sp. AiPa1 TaxID=573492 RepID=UPI00202B08FE|nr:hypothetical protein [Frankia sp. AiPa1]MCL9759242.1 hypothetical protein [Frankia sp. AiPa1]